jgi:hypothetical protein
MFRRLVSGLEFVAVLFAQIRQLGTNLVLVDQPRRRRRREAVEKVRNGVANRLLNGIGNQVLNRLFGRAIGSFRPRLPKS